LRLGCIAWTISEAPSFALQFNLSDPGEAERIFKALAEKGTIQVPLQETFWALRFGVLVDQFAIPWVINCEKAA